MKLRRTELPQMSLMEEERFQNQNDERSNVCGSPHAEGAKIKKKRN